MAIMVMFGDGSVAQVLLSTGQETAPGGNGFGAYQSINWGYVVSSLLPTCSITDHIPGGASGSC